MRFGVAFLLTACAWGQVPLTVQNAASSTAGIAPGSLIALTPASPALTALGCVSCVTVTIQPQDSTQIFTAQVVSAPPPDYWAVVPDGVPPGPATITWTQNGASAGLSANVTISQAAPGLFSVGLDGFGPALAQNIVTPSTPALNQLANPVLPGGLVTLWGTGLGIGSATGDVTVYVAGTPAIATFAGPAPGLPGVDQINFELPANPSMGCYVPVTVRSTEAIAESNTVTLSINPTPGACAHPLGLSYSDLQALDHGGQISIGAISLVSRMPAAAPPAPIPLSPQPGQEAFTSSASAILGPQNAEQVFLAAQPQAPVLLGCVSPPVGGFITGILIAGGGAGNQLTLSGPAGASLSMPGNGFYSGTSTTPWVPGTWQISAPGGPDINAFQQAFTLPPLPTLTSVSQLGWLTEGAGDVVVAWNPQGYGAGDIMTVELGNVSPTNGSFMPSVLCTAFAFEGQVLEPAPHVGPVPVPDTISLSVSPLPAARTLFPLPLASGGTAPAVIGYNFSTLQPIVPALTLGP